MCTQYTTTWTSSGDNGRPTTGAGIIDVTTDANGNVITSTMQLPYTVTASCHVCETKPTVVTTVIDSTVTITQGCDVIVTTNADGSVYTTTEYDGVQSTVAGYSAVSSGDVALSLAVVIASTVAGNATTYTLPLGTTTIPEAQVSSYLGANLPGAVVSSTNADGDVVVSTVAPVSPDTTSLPSIVEGGASSITRSKISVVVAGIVAVLLL